VETGSYLAAHTTKLSRHSDLENAQISREPALSNYRMNIWP